MSLTRKSSRKPWRRSALRRKLLAMADRTDRMLQTEGLAPSVYRDIETIGRAARRAVRRL